MNEKFSERRQAENEVFFRELNEKVEKSFKELEQLAKEENADSWIQNNDMPLYFFCECADENCRERIKLKPSIYKNLHKDRSEFIVIKGHEVEEIEEVVAENTKYYIVRKRLIPPKKADRLNPTDTQNT